VSRTVECFYPGASFPSISTTGVSCALDCKHCGRKYLEGMMPAPTPEDLLGLADVLAKRGAAGFLLSGGVDRDGIVRLEGFVDAIREVKATTDLRVNAHIGLARRDDIRRLVDAGVDAFSVDVYGSDDTIREVLGLPATTRDYLRVVEDLRDAGAPNITPHLCIGLHRGELRGEHRALQDLVRLEPDSIVFISLIPTKGTQFESVRAPSGEDVVSVISSAREMHPGARLLLGCMRSKRDRSWEFDAVQAGVDGIVLPSEGTVERLTRSGIGLRKRTVCCALQ